MVSVRPATVGDAEVVARLVDALLMELSDRPSQLAARVKVARDLLGQAPRIHGFLAESGGQAVGAMMLSESMAIYAAGRVGIITELYVVPEHRSDGVARLLVDAGAALGRRLGWTQLEVGAPSQPRWRRSLAFYEGYGFSVIGPRLRFPLGA